MAAGRRSPPPGAAKAALVVVIAGILAILVIFVGRNIWHADTLQEQHSGEVAPADAPQTPRDLQHEPVPQR